MQKEELLKGLTNEQIARIKACNNSEELLELAKEEGTASYNFKNQVRSDIKQKRLDELMSLQQKISYELNKKHIGEVMTGLVVGKENDYYLLRSYWNAPDDVDGKILFHSARELKEGDIVTVKILESYVYDLYGELVN